MIRGIDHVQLAAPPGAEVAARRFFGELLELREVEKPEALRRRGGVWFAAGNQQLHVGIEEGFAGGAAKAHPALAVGTVSELKSLAERLAAAGSPVVWDEAIPGLRRFYTADPWDNRIELIATGEM